METRRWTNPSQPQTLYVATILLYLGAIMEIIFGGLVNLLGVPAVLVYIIGSVAAGLGIANERRWGYIVGVVAASLGVLPLLLILMRHGIVSILSVNFLLDALFPVALFALLVHPMSREYQKIWFH
jgi:hypothetical protein